MENKMLAIICTRYGPPEVLQLKEVNKPTPKDQEVLIKVHAASVNAADLEILSGTLSARFTGPLKPRHKIPGSDIAGRIEAVGGKVKQFQPGDEVFGDSFISGFGAFAEYVCVPENILSLKPPSITFEDAATLPQAAIIALQNLRGKRQVHPGQQVLINGAGGGMGTFAVQIAKLFGAEVTGVDKANKFDKLRSIGADYVIDYTQEDFTKSGQSYDHILDIQAHHSIFAYKRSLRPKGIYTLIGGSKSAIFQALLLGPIFSLTGSKKMGINTWKPNKKEDVDFLIDLLETGKIKPTIDRRYPLSKAVDAYRYLEEGNHKGKLVITIKNEN